MNIIEKVVQSEYAPDRHNVLWLKGNQLYGFVEGDWRLIGGAGETVRFSLTDTAANKALLADIINNHPGEKIYTTTVNLDNDLGGKGVMALDLSTGSGSIIYFETSTLTHYVIGSDGSITASTDSTVGLFDNVKFTAQDLTTAQKAQARTNIDVYSKAEVNALVTYEDIYAYGIEWDTAASTPICTRIGNLGLHATLPIQSQMQGCVHNGSTIAYFLNPDDWSKKVDGTTSSILDGTDGEVGVHIPKFYGKSGMNGTKMWVKVSLRKIDDTWVEIPEAIVGAYRATIDKTDSTALKAVSVVNTTTNYRGGGDRSAYDGVLATYPFKTDLGKPRTNLSRSTMRTYARNAGHQLMYYNYYKWMCWLYYIEYANFNVQATFNASKTEAGYSQGGLGAGVSEISNWSTFNGYYPIVPCGFTNQFGNGTNIKDTGTIEDGTTTVATHCYVPRWRGIEQPFGDVWTNLDGIVCKAFVDDNSVYHRHYYSTWNPTYFDDTETNMDFVGEEVASNGCIGEFTLGLTGEMVPADVTGGSTTKKCDYHYQDSPNTGYRTVLVGGDAAAGAANGLACFGSDNGVGFSSTYIGFRTITLV